MGPSSRRQFICESRLRKQLDSENRISWQNRPAMFQLEPAERSKVTKIAKTTWRYETADGSTLGLAKRWSVSPATVAQQIARSEPRSASFSTLLIETIVANGRARCVTIVISMSS